MSEVWYIFSRISFSSLLSVCQSVYVSVGKRCVLRLCRMEVSRESAVSTQACASPPLLTGGMERYVATLYTTNAMH